MNANNVTKMRGNKKTNNANVDNTANAITLATTLDNATKTIYKSSVDTQLTILNLESKNAELSKQLHTIFTKVNAIDTHIDWDNNRPFQKIRKFGLFTISNWTEILEIIKQLVKLARQYKDDRSK
jgi:hypothetical protein